MMNVKRGDNNIEKLEKFQSWRLYNPEYNKPKPKNKAPSLSPKPKENHFHHEQKFLSPVSKLGKIGNNIIGHNMHHKIGGNNPLPSSVGYIYLNNGYNYQYSDLNKKLDLPPKKQVMIEESKENNILDLHDNTFSYKDTKHINEPLEINNNHNHSYQENVERISELTLDMSIVSSHMKFLEIWADLEISLDNKQLINAICNRYLKDFETEILGKSLIMDIFSSANLNRTFGKILKIKLLLIFLIKLLIVEFSSYDIMSVRNQLKRILTSFSETMAMFVELFVFYNLNNTFLADYKILVERFNKLSKKTNTKSKKRNEDLFNINKLLETTLASIKTFSNTIFNVGLFSAVHNVAFELIRNVDKLSAQKMGYIMVNNLLFAISKKEENTRLPKFGKQFNPSFLLGNKATNINKVKRPYLPPVEDTNTYTLVLDLDETLVHFFYTPAGGTFFVRPGAFDFLKSLSELFEIVIFTAGMKDYADNILDLIDPNYQLIKHRLYRHHTSLYGAAFVKDLNNIGRDLTRTMIIDNLPDNFVLQPYNGLAIKTWTDDIGDTQLYDLLKIMKDIHHSKVKDVRDIVKKINEEAAKSYRTNNMSPYAHLDISSFLENI